jgi:hypothetical protein
MKNTTRRAKPVASTALAASEPMTALGRITLALLDEYKGERQGYDPYDTSGRTRDPWRAKRKRA